MGNQIQVGFPYPTAVHIAVIDEGSLRVTGCSTVDPPEADDSGDDNCDADVKPQRLPAHEAAAKDIRTLQYPDRADDDGQGARHVSPDFH